VFLKHLGAEQYVQYNSKRATSRVSHLLKVTLRQRSMWAKPLIRIY